MADVLGSAGVHAMGAQTYRDMAAHWPYQDGPEADAMNRIPKVVFSRRPIDTPWATTTVCSGDLATEVAGLKAQDGGPILAHGGVRFAQALVRADLVDEYHLLINPVAHGESTAGLDLWPERDLSAGVMAHFATCAEDLRRTAPATRQIVEPFERLVARLGQLELPRGDFVHGDSNGDPEVRRLIRRAGESAAGPEVLAFCASVAALDNVRFRAHHRPAHKVAGMRPGLERLVADLAESCL